MKKDYEVLLVATNGQSQSAFAGEWLKKEEYINVPSTPGPSQSAFAGEWLKKSWKFPFQGSGKTVAIRFRWRMVEEENTRYYIYNEKGRNPLSLENG